MAQKYNSDNYAVKFIKNLLKDTYVPTIPIWKEGKPLVKDFLYIYKNNIVKAKLNSSDKNFTNSFSNRNFEILHSYEFGKQYFGISSNYISNSSIYDYETHKYLGNYLRMLRDIKGIDLFPYYNCFSGVYSDRLRRNKTVGSYERVIETNQTNDGLTTLIVPIQFDQDYTIFINCSHKMQFSVVYYDGNNIIDRDNKGGLSDNIKDFDKTYYNCSFNEPISFKVDTRQETTVQNKNSLFLKDYLTLLIELPKSDANNILILEGNYKENRFFENNKIKKVIIDDNSSKQEKEKKYITVPSLTLNVENISYAFSDRLLEYLLLNVIDNNDMIYQNVERVQEYISSKKLEDKYGMRYSSPRPAFVKGVWDDNIREFIYNLIINNPRANRYDINGYVDKDTEMLLLGGK